MAGRGLKPAKKPDCRGFTLIEILAILSIAAFIGVIAFVFLNSSRKRARDARRSSDVQQIYAATTAYFVENAQYPLTEPGVQPSAFALPGLFTVRAVSNINVPNPAAGLHAWTELESQLSSLSSLPRDPWNVVPKYYVYTIFVDASGNPMTVWMNDQGYGMPCVVGLDPIPGGRSFRGYIQVEFETIEPHDSCYEISTNQKIVYLP